MTTLKAPEAGVKVRMYRQGLGDCFLLAFPTAEAGRTFYMLIDCGVILGTQSPKEIMTKVAEDIEAVTGGDIHLLVITHEHWDHVSGILQAGEVFGRLRIHNLWFAWTEDPSDELANRLRAEFQKDRNGLRMAVNRALDAGSVEHITNLLDFFGSALGAAGAKNDTGAALQAARDFAKKAGAKPRYLHPGDGPLPLPKAGGLPDVPGARIYVLGPPHDEKILKHIDPSAKGKEVYTEGAALTLRQTFLMAAHRDETELPAEDRELLNLCFPFDQRVRTPRKDAEQVEFFKTHYAPDWQRIDDDWLGVAGELALQLDSYTNNSSLVMAIELTNTRKVLLFAADAQVGNWLSWDALTWSVKDGGDAAKTIKIDDLLRRTVLYKVGHHGSYNATIRAFGPDKKGLELMTSPDLVAMLPVDHDMAVKKGWGKMPFTPLMHRLQEKTSRRVMRIDDALPKPKPDGMSDEDWRAFKAHFEENELYMQYTVAE